MGPATIIFNGVTRANVMALCRQHGIALGVPGPMTQRLRTLYEVLKDDDAAARTVVGRSWDGA